jgi:hypothetical protein
MKTRNQYGEGCRTTITIDTTKQLSERESRLVAAVESRQLAVVNLDPENQNIQQEDF